MWMAAEQAAEYLQMGKSTVHRLVHESRIPVHKVGRQWRFDAKELDRELKSGKLANLEERS